MRNAIATSVARNTTVMLAQQLSTWLSTFILMLFLPRYLGPIEYGRLYLALTIAGIFGNFVNYGGFQTVSKLVARSPESTHLIFGNAFGFRLVVSLISVFGMLVFSIVAGYGTEQRILNLIFSATLIWQAGNVALYGCYQGRELLAYTSYGAVAEKVFVSALGVTALLLGAGAITIACVMALSSLVNFVVLLKFSSRIMTSVPKINWRASFGILKQDVHFFLFAIFGAIYYRIDTIMLSLLAPEKVVGWYGASYRFFDVLNFLPSIFTIAAFPVLSKLWKNEEQTHARTMQKSLEFMILTGIPIMVIIIGFARPIIQIFYGLQAY